ncbi:MAG: four helix bundle protein [Candidatus Cloacimonetes bacterium]|nr:four helix bundle protein [Candidatus Cloacimonadota bacterium]
MDYIKTAYASLKEFLCQLTLCLDLGYITEAAYQTTREKIDIVAYQLNQLRSAVLNKPSKPSQLPKQRSAQPSKP